MSHPDRRYFWVYMRAKKVGWFTPILDMRNSYVTVSVERNVTLLHFRVVLRRLLRLPVMGGE